MKKHVLISHVGLLMMATTNGYSASSLPTIDALSLLSLPRIDSNNQILYTSTPNTHITTQYVTCATAVAVASCTLDDMILEQGEVDGEGNPSVDITIPNDESLIGQYLTYCVRVTETAFGDEKAASPLECRSEMIDVSLASSRSDSYLSQGQDFSLYEQPYFRKSSQTVTSDSAILTLLPDASPFIYGTDLEVSEMPAFNAPIISFYSMLDSFAVLQEDHQLLAWGHYFSKAPTVVSNVESVYPGPYAMSLVTLDGRISVLGNDAKGASISEVAQHQIQTLFMLGGQVQAIYHTAEAFLGVFNMPEGHQRVVAWGNPIFGGVLPDDVFSMTFDIKNVVTSQNAFALVEHNGDVHTWNGNATLVSYRGVQSVKASRYAFAALTQDGDVFTWGERGYGGQLTPQAKQFTDEKKVTRLCATDAAFLALADDDSGVAAWGDSQQGGYIPNTTQSELDQFTVNRSVSCGSTEGAFALYHQNGLWAWGASKSGGVLPDGLPTSDIDTIIGNNHAFLMKTASGVYSWGDETSGGCIPDGQDCLSLDNASLNLLDDIASMNMAEMEIGSFSQFSEEERDTDTGFYIKDSTRLVTWGQAVPDGRVLF